MIRFTHGAQFSDAQCGFKAARTDVVRPLLAHVQDDGWFFDTELLLLAEHNGLRVHEVPVDWVEDVNSRVRIVSTVVGDVRGLVRWPEPRSRMVPLLNTEANRRLSFAGTGGSKQLVHLQGLVVFALYYALTWGALLALQALVARPSRWLEVTALRAA
jgi:hypothetical protein